MICDGEDEATFLFEECSQDEEAPSFSLANNDQDSDIVDILDDPENSVPVSNEPTPRLKLLSWNVDGLDRHCLKSRMRAVVRLVRANEPDIIFFQEVINPVAEYFERKLPEYKHIRANVRGYFTATLLRVLTVSYDSHKIVQYPRTSMDRNLLVVTAHVGQRKFTLLNTHLESMKDFSAERQLQLRLAFKYAQAVPDETTVIFGGDLNLRDYEEVVPEGFADLWKACGESKNAEFTWDMTRNNNNRNNWEFKPRFRFDRIYFRAERGRVGPTVFRLVGDQRAPGTQMFPSDHWGILACFLLIH